MDKDVLMLLKVCDYAKDWPNLKAIHDVAMDDLNKINEEAAKEMTKRLDARAKEKAEAEAKAAAAAKAKAEAEARASAPRAIPADRVPPPRHEPPPSASPLDRPSPTPTIHRPLEPEGDRG